MNIEVKNNVPNLRINVNQNEDGSVAILIEEDNRMKLGDFNPGSIVRIGSREYIVLDHANETTAVITKDFTQEMIFGKNGDYSESDVRAYCNNAFYKELVDVVGKNNIIPHRVNLEADDGTGKGNTCKDNVSIITTETYRHYREFLKPYGNWWWTATRVNYDNSDYAYSVRYVNSGGVLDWGDCDYFGGVRPFCILNSSVEVKKV